MNMQWELYLGQSLFFFLHHISPIKYIASRGHLRLIADLRLIAEGRLILSKHMS